MQDTPFGRMDQPTEVLIPVSRPLSFHDYMVRYKLLWSDVARVAGVPALVVWSIDHKMAVSAKHATVVRAALEIITGIPFTGSIQTITIR
ncbi:MAG: hypothetical protein H0V70_29230 [Ktedonobacteraceae bacterium]|nr:hypothetical protein [Ktedonobacteraceae bacterium]